MTLGRRKEKYSGSETGDRTQGFSFCVRVIQPLSYHDTAANSAQNSKPNIVSVNAVLLGDCHAGSLQPTAADTIRYSAVYGLTNNYTRKIRSALY